MGGIEITGDDYKKWDSKDGQTHTIDEKKRPIITKRDARALVHWLNLVNGKWESGSYMMDIERLYNELAKFGGVKKTWKWKE